jgi:ATP synthase subunit 6
MLQIFFYSPLEQFEILPVLSLNLGWFDFGITNQVVIFFLVVFFLLVYFFSLLHPTDLQLYIIPTRYQAVIEVVYLVVLFLVNSNIEGEKGQRYFPLIFSIFFFVLSLNLIGLFPFSFTVMTHFIVTFGLSFMLFISMIFFSVREHGFNFFSSFLPSGTPFILALLLVPVEILSYFSRPFALAIRLFCNMMAGHILMAVIAGFSWTLMTCSGFLFILHYIPLIILFFIFCLEFAVAIIQAYVYALLICMYLNSALNLH